MFKIVVLCAFFAAAAAKPGALIPLPITQYSTYVAPATTTISKHDTSIIHPSPALQYYPTAPIAFTHFIKKRSPQLPLTYLTPSSYIAPSTYITPSTYIAPTTYAAGAPLVHTAPILPAVAPITPAVHLIKKRSAPLLPTTYYAPQAYATATAPILTTSYTAPLYPSTHLISPPVTYTHLIKKRSAPLLNTFIAPTAYSHQSRFDLQTTHTPLTSISYAAPITYTNPISYSHLY